MRGRPKESSAVAATTALPVSPLAAAEQFVAHGGPVALCEPDEEGAGECDRECEGDLERVARCDDERVREGDTVVVPEEDGDGRGDSDADPL